MSTGTGASDLLHADDHGIDQIVAGEAPVAARSPLALFWRRFRKDKVALVALTFIVLLVLVAILAPVIRNLVGAPPPGQTSTDALDDFGLPQGPTSEHLFGVDSIGRDIFARVLDGARVSLLVAFIGTGLSVTIGVTLGMIAGFFRGWVDTLIARVIDILLAFPVLLLGLGLASACSTKDGCLGGALEPGLTIVIFIIVLSNWPYVARIIRGQVLSLREKEFVEASRSLGAGNMRIIFREILPNLVAPIIVYASLFIPANILLEAALSFLGVGVTGQASWGQMLSEATGKIDTAWWYMFFPGMALLLTVLAFNLVGDGMQDALNPKGNKQK
ncbi:ABC transporter permease [Solirubrobacter phytolaccae]|uniref:ABC transporter permease n=1 Tax=Solirubrobacter phytolaccae TaxID=1404360 RepID=A0A9X3N9V2_9ACTN|nr:ABC transporter permease [Solirubrobacter phytolaccae]MDA0181050.1 ABC transporter permease [Solirubrobacter phytolaccae]